MGIVNGPEQGNPESVTQPVEEIPENLRGKSPAELASMYQNLERKLGEQSNEIGQLRRLADQALQPSSDREEQELPDFYTDPEKAVEALIERKLRPFSSVVQKQQAQATAQALEKEHPGWRDTVKSEDFQAWVAKSKVRINLWNAGDAGDFDSASELLSTWNGLQGASTAVKSTVEKAVKKDRDLRAATTERGSGRIDGRKILKRTDLQELRRTNPDRYNSLSEDIMKAYREGRVR